MLSRPWSPQNPPLLAPIAADLLTINLQLEAAPHSPSLAGVDELASLARTAQTEGFVSDLGTKCSSSIIRS